MESIKKLLEDKNITLSLLNYDAHDLAVGWEVKAIVENADFFCDYFNQCDLKEINNIDDFYLWLLSRKITGMIAYIPLIAQEENKLLIQRVAECAKNVILAIGNGKIIKYINKNYAEIFDKDNSGDNLWRVAMNIIAEFNTGIDDQVFEYLCKDHMYTMIYMFDQFEKKFEQKPELFNLMFPIDNLLQVCSFYGKQIYGVWEHILAKNKSALKTIVNKCVDKLYKDIMELCKNLTLDNIMRYEKAIHDYNSFLQNIKSPKANKFFDCVKKSEELLNQYINERGCTASCKITSEDVSKWKNMNNWWERLLSITHIRLKENETLAYISKLAKEEAEGPDILDFFGTNIPTDEYFTLSQQDWLSGLSFYEMATFLDIMHNKESLNEYVGIIKAALEIITKCLNMDGEHLQQDADIMFGLLFIIAGNISNENNNLCGIYYGASTFMCALLEKVLRLFYKYLAKDDIYIPNNKATLGSLLNENNKYLVNTLGKDYIKNLSYFLQQDSNSQVGYNIRNNLAHWADIESKDLTIYYTSRIMWLFTDVLNTVFWYCLVHKQEGENK